MQPITKSNWIEGKVLEHINWTETLASIKIDAKVKPYVSGQFTRIALEINNEIISRPYSYVSSPLDNFLEIVYTKIPNGILTPKLSKLKPGDKILVNNNSYGYFVMNEVPEGDNLWMIGTGTGSGVFISLLKTEEPWNRFNKIILIHGVRKENELTYQDQIKKFNLKYPHKFIYIKSVTREKIKGCLNIRIPNGINNGKLESISNTKISKSSQFMLCGNPDMIKETISCLNNKGIEINRKSKLGNITIEKYW